MNYLAYDLVKQQCYINSIVDHCVWDVLRICYRARACVGYLLMKDVLGEDATTAL